MWTKNKANISKAIKEDSHPVSLLALELRSRTKEMTLKESTRLAKLLIKLIKN